MYVVGRGGGMGHIERSVQNTRTRNHDTAFLNNLKLIKIACKILLRQPEGNILENLDVGLDGRLIFKLILKQLDMK
jgi:hypothetical protein